MNEDKDSRLARWSRRKLAARHGRAEEADYGSDEEIVDVPTDDALPACAFPEESASESSGPAEPLPRIEDLTAESDLTAFLKKGVPTALKSAALRKMWSIDPRIRDYVGPAEYAWDFNQPGSMAGFGPLDAKETVVGFLSRTTESVAQMVEKVAEPRAAESSAEATIERPADTPQSAGVSRAAPPVAQRPEPVAAQPFAHTIATARPFHSPLHAVETPGSLSDDRSDPEAELPARPRHGGALPR